ncbi:TetR/AcrR family transcriptional regulator [Actinacidiphila paucisporea]|uniref:Transcriptional regulator, TetR family n=1 Tax=Actinacidiphila paucisporea TaxID=310782 RepID=A0A1M7PIB8_9ACTN|nr:TetR family transcriptional regulator [Actinacidiphila paucisporea]SHN16685.1 transcriptional regulator, TetR family [Actinacidiphila paucisporea]
MSGTASGTPAGTPSGTPAGDGTPRRRGRPAGTGAGAGAGTRERILAAAREEFSAHGFDKTSVRSIGKAAGVDAALVHHYFGTKEQVFAAAIELSFGPALELPAALAAGDHEGMGERVARFMLGIWEDPVSREPLLAIVRSAVTNERAAAVFRGLVGRRVLARVAGELRVPDPEFRVQLAAAQLVGIIMLRYVVKVEPMASAEPEDLVALVAPTLQRYLTDPDVRPGAGG